MGVVDRSSLWRTLDAVNEVLFLGGKLATSDRLAAARWIAGRQGLPGSYAEMFAPTAGDFRDGIRVFTGERASSRAGTAHILGEEAMRALVLLEVHDSSVREALARAREGMEARVRETEVGGHRAGRFCCGICSTAFWRNLAAGGLGPAGQRLARGLRELRRSRTEEGKWWPFPFWYTVLALCDSELPAAAGELRFAAPVCERYLKTRRAGDRYAERRRALAERALGKC